MTNDEMAQLRSIKSCDCKDCCRKGGIYIGDFVDYGNGWLSERDGVTPTIPVFVCEKHAKKIYKILGINEYLL